MLAISRSWAEIQDSVCRCGPDIMYPFYPMRDGTGAGTTPTLCLRPYAVYRGSRMSNPDASWELQCFLVLSRRCGRDPWRCRHAESHPIGNMIWLPGTW